MTVAYSRSSTAERVEAVTIRGGSELPPRDYDYGFLRIVRTTVQGGQAANALLERRVASVPAPMLPDVKTDGSVAVWVTQGDSYGLIAPTATPRLVHWHGWSPTQSPIDEQRPLAARGQPFYPTVRAALLEILYGRASTLTNINPLYRLEVSLAYNRAYIGEVIYVQDVGLTVEVGKASSDQRTGDELHVVWQQHPSEVELHRWSNSVDSPQQLVVPMDGPPLNYTAALVDPAGYVIDQCEGTVRSPQVDEIPLPPTALLDALEFLDSAWRVFFKRRLIERPRLSGVADLSQPVGNRADFSTHVTHLDDLVKALRIDDDLLPTAELRALPATASLARMRGALTNVLTGPDLDAANAALDALSAANALRVAFQHKVDPRKSPDLPSALARFGIDYPPNWSSAWAIVVRRIVDAVGEVRRVLLVNSP